MKENRVLIRCVRVWTTNSTTTLSRSVTTPGPRSGWNFHNFLSIGRKFDNFLFNIIKSKSYFSFLHLVVLVSCCLHQCLVVEEFQGVHFLSVLLVFFLLHLPPQHILMLLVDVLQVQLLLRFIHFEVSSVFLQDISLFVIDFFFSDFSSLFVFDLFG